MKTFNDYINESAQKYTHKTVLKNIKKICGASFNFIESSRHGDKLRILIKSNDENVTVTYDNSKMFGGKDNFTISIFSQNLSDKNLKQYVALISYTQMMVDRLVILEKEGQLEALEDAHG